MQKISMRTAFLLAISIATLLLPASPAAAAVVAADTVLVGSGSAAPSGTVDIPVSIRDASGSPLGVDHPPGSHIQSFSIKVDYAPASAIQSITFTRGGITTSLTPAFESSPSGPGTVSLLETFQESTNPIPFTSNAPGGNQVGVLHVTIAPGATPGTAVALTLDPTLTQLTDQSGSGATKETVTAGNLTLVNGVLTVSGPIPTLSTWALILLAALLSFVALRLRS